MVSPSRDPIRGSTKFTYPDFFSMLRQVGIGCALFFLAGCQAPQELGPLTNRSPEYRFAFIGDYGNRSYIQEWAADDLWINGAKSIVTVGDNIYPNPSVATYEATIGPYFSWWLDQGTFYPALGNHDWDSPEGSRSYERYFGRTRYYDVDLDPAGRIHVYVLDSDPREPDGIDVNSKQAQWFRGRLEANRTRSCFHFVVFHHPVVSTNTNPQTICDGCEPRPEMDWAYETLGVDGVFVGHAHFAERFQVRGLNHWIVGNTTNDIDTDVFTRTSDSKYFRAVSGYLMGEVGPGWVSLGFRLRGANRFEDVVTLEKTCSP